MYEDAQGDAEERDKDARDAASKNKHSISTFYFSQHSSFCEIWRFIN